MSRRDFSVAAWVLGTALSGLVCACAARTAASGPAPVATPTPMPPPPAAQIPDQPYVGTPRPVEQPFLVILRLKESGASNAELLAKVRRENVAYSMSTFDIQKLRAAGVSEDVIAAMLGSGREARTPTPRAS